MEPRKFIRNVDNSSVRGGDNDIDRISGLPDSVLGVILSLIPTKNALATSVLSKRWEFLWRMLHNLDFCHEDLSLGLGQVEDKKFVDYVNHVLIHNNAGMLNKFRLVWRTNCIESHVTSWIQTAVTRNVRELYLVLDFHNGRFDMPISVFSCDSLRSLHLNCWSICLSAPNAFRLPRLEILYLHGVTFRSDKDFEKIITGCPVLNDLDIYMDGNDDDFRFNISSTSLKRLVLSLGEDKYVKLDASSLEHLLLYNNESMVIVKNNLSSLVEAVFRIYSAFRSYLDYDGDPFQVGAFNSVVRAVSALGCAKSIELSDDVMLALSGATINLSTDFKRLVELKTECYCCDWKALLDLIQRSNNLELLTIEKGLMDRSDEHDHSNWINPVEVPRCLSTSLKKVVIYGYNGYEDEREMIRYMLNHGSVLEVMQISFHQEMKGLMFEQVQEICEYPRMSAICEFKFIGWTSKGKDKVCCTVPPATFPFISFVPMKSSD